MEATLSLPSNCKMNKSVSRSKHSSLSQRFLSCLQKEREKKKEDKKKEKDADRVDRHNNIKVQMLHTCSDNLLA